MPNCLGDVCQCVLLLLLLLHGLCLKPNFFILIYIGSKREKPFWVDQFSFFAYHDTNFLGVSSTFSFFCWLFNLKSNGVWRTQILCSPQMWFMWLPAIEKSKSREVESKYERKRECACFDERRLLIWFAFAFFHFCSSNTLKHFKWIALHCTLCQTASVFIIFLLL